MSKIMFNKHYGLETAVIEGYKTKTRREEKSLRVLPTEYNHMLTEIEFYPYDLVEQAIPAARYYMGNLVETFSLKPRYKIGEKVAIAQAYSDILPLLTPTFASPHAYDFLREEKGYRNKMFVMEKYMPHHIEITGIKVERLQDICNEDCLCEGVLKWLDCYIVAGIMERGGNNNECFDTPRLAFARLIDKVSKKGTWERNPWVYVYSFIKCQDEER